MCGSRGGKDLKEIQSISKTGRQRYGPSDYQRNPLEHWPPGKVLHQPHYANFPRHSWARNLEESEALAVRTGKKQVPPTERERVMA
jgi:hypothetical protein